MEPVILAWLSLNMNQTCEDGGVFMGTIISDFLGAIFVEFEPKMCRRPKINLI